jgi:hypothetical protein
MVGHRGPVSAQSASGPAVAPAAQQLPPQQLPPQQLPPVASPPLERVASAQATPREPSPPAAPAILALDPGKVGRGAAAKKRWQRERQERRKADVLQRRGFFPALSAPPRTDTSRLSHWLLGTALVGLCTALIAVVAIGSRKEVDAEITAVGGHEVLELRCARCDDGDRVELDGNSSTFHNQVATLALSTKLPVGPNHLEPTLVGGQLFGDQTLELDIPVQFRLRPVTEGLGRDTPVLAIEVEAQDDTVVELDGHRVPIAGGQGRYELDVQKELVGEATALATFERSVVYEVKPSQGRVHSGKLSLSFSALPLMVEAPGPMVVLDTNTFTLAGRTTAGATLKLDGRPLALHDDGAFAQLLNVDSEGETTIWLSTSMPGHATRRYPIRVRRVASLEQEAERFSKTASDNFARVRGHAADEQGLAVMFEGKLRAVRQLPYSTKALLDVSPGCSGRCTAQLSHGGRLKLRENSRVVAYGHVAGETKAPDGSTIPEVQTLMVLRKH